MKVLVNNSKNAEGSTQESAAVGDRSNELQEMEAQKWAEAEANEVQVIKELPVLRGRKGMPYKEMIPLIGSHFVKMPSKEVLFPKDGNGDIDFTAPISSSRFILDMCDLGFNLSEDKWNKILSDDRIDSVEPLQIILDVIKQEKWTGRNWIKELAVNLNLKGNASENFELLYKYLCTMYQTAFQGYDEVVNWEVFNRVCLILLSYERGTKKSSIARKIGLQRILPRITGLNAEVQTDYAGQVEREKNVRKIHLATYFSINLDDIDEMLMNREDMGKLRSIISSNNVDYRMMWTQSLNAPPRRATFIATTNNQTVLRDKDENRYLVFELTKGIDDKWIDEFDALDMWRQVREIVHMNKQLTMFNKVDRDLIKSRAKYYAYETLIEEIVQEKLEYCEQCSMEFKDIRGIIRAEGYFTDTEIGRALQKLPPEPNMAKKKVNGYWRYRFQERK
ncbi:MAG: VapE domain-containing protein [Flavobacteriales bacterium]